MSKRIIHFGIVALVLLIFAGSCEKGVNETANCEIKQEIPVPKHKEGILMVGFMKKNGILDLIISRWAEEWL